MLQPLGLSPTGQAMYELLLTGPPRTAEEVRGLAAGHCWTVPVPVVMQELQELGLVAAVPGDPPRFTVVPPSAALGALVTARERALVAARRRMNQLTARYRPPAGPLEPVEVVHGRKATAERCEEILRSARREVRVFDTPPYVGEPREPNPTERELLRRGIRFRVIYDRHGVEVPGRLVHIEAEGTAGETARVADVPIKLVMSDRPAAIMPLFPHPASAESSLIVHDPVLLAALSALFEMYWEQAVPLHFERDRPGMTDPRAPTQIDRTLLRLLAAGLTEPEIADHLGSHKRTVHRHLRAMMRRLDAATRFQAGYQAVRRGWLTDPGGGDNG